jgi:hypothetical protein
MKTSTVLVGITLAALTPGCAANTEPTEEDRAFMAELREPAEGPSTVLTPAVTRKPVAGRRNGEDPGCPTFGCGSNHNRRVMRLAQEAS